MARIEVYIIAGLLAAALVGGGAIYLINKGEALGTAAMTMTPDRKDGQGRAFVPSSDNVLAATRLIEAGQSERLKLTAPAAEGAYEMVCTYPGHWMVMWGKLIVTADVDAYMAAHPQPEELPPTFAQPEAGSCF